MDPVQAGAVGEGIRADLLQVDGHQDVLDLGVPLEGPFPNGGDGHIVDVVRRGERGAASGIAGEAHLAVGHGVLIAAVGDIGGAGLRLRTGAGLRGGEGCLGGGRGQGGVGLGGLPPSPQGKECRQGDHQHPRRGGDDQPLLPLGRRLGPGPWAGCGTGGGAGGGSGLGIRFGRIGVQDLGQHVHRLGPAGGLHLQPP